MRLSRLLSLVPAFALVLMFTNPSAAWQQGGGGGAAPPGGGGGATPPGGGSTAPGPGTTTPGRTPTPQQPTFPGQTGQQQQRDSPFEMQRPIFLSGKVMTSDGVPPPESVTIEMVCNGMPRPQGYTDSKGRFSINLGQNNNVLPDASVGNVNDPFGGGIGGMNRGSTGMGGSRGISERDLMGCELRANLPGFRSDSLPLAGRRLLDNPDVGTIFLHRLGNVEGFTYSLTSANAPKDAKKAYEKGLDQYKKKKYADAETSFQKAVTAYPQYATAWFELGRTLESQDKKDAARDAFQKAVESDAKFVKPYLHLMQHDLMAQDWQRLRDTTTTILRLNPFNFPQAWFYNSVANLQLRKLDDAEKGAREALKLDERHRFPKISHLLGVILAEKQEFPEALEHMKGYLTMAPNAGDADVVRRQVGEIERFLGARQVGQAPAAGTPPPQN